MGRLMGGLKEHCIRGGCFFWEKRQNFLATTNKMTLIFCDVECQISTFVSFNGSGMIERKDKFRGDEM